MNAVRWLATFLLPVALAGCSAAEPPTEVLVRINADAFVIAHATNLHVTIHGGTADTVGPNVVDSDYPKSPTGVGLGAFPQIFAISPTGGDVTRYFDVVARGDLDDGRQVEQHFAGAYLAHRVAVLDMWLRQTCVAVPCAPTTTCSDGACVAVQITPDMLHDLDAGTDAFVTPDGATDGGPDANGDAGCISDTQCDDHVFCNGREICSGGACTPGTAPSCDDSVACTTDSCDAAADACHHSAVDTLCTAGTGGHCDVAHGGCQYDTCDSTTCVPTTGTCEVAICTDSTTCDRHSSCSASQDCCAGACVPTGCDDGMICTHDACGASGCTHVPNTIACDDGNACTVGDHCGGGSCLAGGSALPCDDGNACTDDSCDMFAGCVHLPNSNVCSDGNACTTGDVCTAGTCGGSATLSCDDGVACTHDSCDPASGCHDVADDSLCTVMSGGHCDPASGCQYPTCTGASCMSDPTMCISAACSGGMCNRMSTCGGGQTCCGGTCAAPGCDDGNPCTDDFCAGSGGCMHTPNTHPCDDGNQCTVMDMCNGGSCRAGFAAMCDDGNQCTTDGCAPATGCTHMARGGPCNDGDLCTIGEMCFGTVCGGGTTNSCDDGNPCTNDTCSPGIGCMNMPNGLCADGGPPSCGSAGMSCCPDGGCAMPSVCSGGTCTCLPDDSGVTAC